MGYIFGENDSSLSGFHFKQSCDIIPNFLQDSQTSWFSLQGSNASSSPPHWWGEARMQGSAHPVCPAPGLCVAAHGEPRPGQMRAYGAKDMLSSPAPAQSATPS